MSDNNSWDDGDWIWSRDPNSEGSSARSGGGSDLDPRIIKWAGLVIGIIFLPVLFIVYSATVYTWKKTQFATRWLYVVSLGTVLIATVLSVFTSFNLTSFLSAFGALFTDEGNFGENFLTGLPNVLLLQLPFAISVGLLAASIRVFMLKRALKKRLHEKGEDYLEASMLMERRAKKTREEIARGVNSPASGSTLGVARDLRDPNGALGAPGETYGKRVVLSADELSAHAFVVGGSGSGKTQTMLAMARDSIRQGNGVVFVDCKGGPDVPVRIAEFAERYGRTFHHWTIHDPDRRYTGPAEDGPSYYDPVARGDASRRKDLLIGAMKWDLEYYRSVISNFLQTLFRVKDLVPPVTPIDTLTDVTDLLNHNALLHRARYIDTSENVDLVSSLTRFKDADDTERSGIRSMYMRLHTIITSVAGHWMRMDPEGKKDIDLRRVVDEGQVVVFSLDTSNYEETAQLIAGLIVQDLKTLSSELRIDPAERSLQVFIDEFSAVDSTNILGLLSKARDAKVSCVLATQALADLARTVPAFKDQVLSIVSTFIFHRTNTSEDAEVYAGLSGVEKQLRRTAGIDGRIYEVEHEQTVVSRGEFQKLKQGEAIVVVKSPALRYINYVEVVAENPNFASSDRDPGLPGPSGRFRNTIYEPKKTYPHPELVKLQKQQTKPANPVAEPKSTPKVSIETQPFQVVDEVDVEVPMISRPRVSKPAETNAAGKPAGAPMPNVGKDGEETPGEK